MPRRFWGLLLAVVHHGMANLAETARPAHSETVMNTADDFNNYLDEVPVRPKRT